MRRLTILFSIFFALINCIYSHIHAETKTATFDFTINSYNFPECTSKGEILTKRIPTDTKIEENGISMILAPSPNGGSNFAPCWYKPDNVLYFYKDSSFTLSAIQANDVIKQVVITFTDGMSETKSYFIESFKNFAAITTYTFSNNVGTLEINDKSLSEVSWYCKDNPIQIKKIEVLYEVDPATSVTETIAQDYRLETGSGYINVMGKYTSIEVYNISGCLISKNNAIVYCHPGIYIVKVDGKARKVIVK